MGQWPSIGLQPPPEPAPERHSESLLTWLGRHWLLIGLLLVAVVAVPLVADGLRSVGGCSGHDYWEPAMSADGRSVAYMCDGYHIMVADSQTGKQELASKSTDGSRANDSSDSPSLSSNGRYVAFSSQADNLGGGELGDDIFVHDRVTGRTELMSVSSAGVPGNDGSEYPVISGNGRFVVFISFANNLVANDTADDMTEDEMLGDVFVHDRIAGTTERVNLSSGGDEANRGSGDAAISADGRFVVFASKASNLVAGDRNRDSDIFLHDRRSGTTELVSVSSSGQPGNVWSGGVPVISADGRFVVFESAASNLVPYRLGRDGGLFLRDRRSRTTEQIDLSSAGIPANGNSFDAAISADGRFVVFASSASNLVAGDTNGQTDIFLRDRQRRTTERVSVSSSGEQARPSIHTITLYGDTTPSPAEPPIYDLSLSPSISADGRVVSFYSDALNLVPGTREAGNIFFYRRLTRVTTRLH